MEATIISTDISKVPYLGNGKAWKQSIPELGACPVPRTISTICRPTVAIWPREDDHCEI